MDCYRKTRFFHRDRAAADSTDSVLLLLLDRMGLHSDGSSTFQRKDQCVEGLQAEPLQPLEMAENLSPSHVATSLAVYLLQQWAWQDERLEAPLQRQFQNQCLLLADPERRRRSRCYIEGVGTCGTCYEGSEREVAHSVHGIPQARVRTAIENSDMKFAFAFASSLYSSASESTPLMLVSGKYPS